MDASKFSSISQVDTDEGVGEFWDTHDFTEFDNPGLPDVEFTMACAVPIEIELFWRLKAHRAEPDRAPDPTSRPHQ
ncbi:MAG: hypothetical protein IPO15_25745 [Anaerolineae bacterium]|uniref:hypothetical protein n=1 Tax=Candidatus Amarolinea dominans TaxID=3140696 RepID=UPI003136337A|nr:hypothetical protein [Anaerolineae bacterium]